MPFPELEKTIVLAASAHAGQKDKGDEPYILHLLRVMLKFKDYDGRTTALLHDIVEDQNHTAYGLSSLKLAGYPNHIVDAVNALTRRKGESYDDFISRVEQNELATRVKIADLEDNMDHTRLKEIKETDKARLEKYFKAHYRLKGQA